MKQKPTLKGFSILMLNLAVIGAFGVILAIAVVGMIEPPAGNMYFGNACPQSHDLGGNTEVARVY